METHYINVLENSIVRWFNFSSFSPPLFWLTSTANTFRVVLLVSPAFATDSDKALFEP